MFRVSYMWGAAVGALSLVLLLLMHAVAFATGIADLPDAPSLRPGKALLLQEAVKLADENNRSLMVVRADIQIASSKLKASWSILIPNLYGNMAYTLRDHEDVSSQNLVTRDKHEVSVGIEARMPLIDAQRWMGIDATRAQRDLTQLTVEQTRQELLYTVAVAYFQAVTLKGLISVFNAQEDALARHLEAAKVRYSSGVGSLVDVKQAETDLAKIREQQIRAVFALEDTRDALALLIASDEAPLPVENPQEISMPEVPTSAAGAPYLSERWDLKVARGLVSIADKQLTFNYMEFVPTLSASWQYGYAVTQPSSLTGSDRDRWFAGFVMSVPLFDYTIYPKLQEQQASLRQANLLLEDRVATASVEVTQAIRGIEQAQYLVKTAEVKARLADDTLELSQTNYINGRGEALVVIDAQRSSRTAHVDLETRRFELELSRLAYLRAIGKDITALIK